jgi:hypothetical protein
VIVNSGKIVLQEKVEKFKDLRSLEEVFMQSVTPDLKSVVGA